MENRKFSRNKQEYQIKASHRFLGIVYPAMLSMGAEIDQRIWAANRAWRELYGMWWNKRVPYKIQIPHGPHCTSSPRSRLPSFAEVLGKKAPRAHARNGLMGRTRSHKDPQLSPSVEKVAVGDPCIRALCTMAQLVPEHCQRAHTSCTSSLLLVWPNALRIVRRTH